MTVLRRRILIRSALVLLWVGLGVLLFVTRRGHTLLVDNKGDPAGAYGAVDLMVVKMNGGKGVEFFKGDRDKFALAGSRHRIRIEFADGRSPEERDFTLPLKHDVYLLSVPKMLAGVEPFLEPFAAAFERPAEEEELPSFEFTSAPAAEVPAPPTAPLTAP